MVGFGEFSRHLVVEIHIQVIKDFVLGLVKIFDDLDFGVSTCDFIHHGTGLAQLSE